ncbi:cell division protein FtsQ/DivIB [Halalkalibaculum sp. DA3122]|uniref:cell division protein FtsQ/DivIB n=1 Tax=unclassified Halalkalibaculum TaxID=2964617 RepID=UPI0037550387
MTKQNKQQSEDQPAKGLNLAPWLASVLLLLVVAVAAGVYWNRTMIIRDVEYTGHHFVTEQELTEQVHIPTGISPDSVDFMAIINKLETVPYVKQADVNVEPSGNLSVHVTERQPIAMLANGENKIYVDQDGIRLPLKLGKTVDVPIVYGFQTAPVSDTLTSGSWDQVRSFLMELNNSSFSRATISEIAWTDSEGIVALSHENGVKLVFGKGEFSRKFRNWKAFYSEVVREKGIRKMRSVDLRFEGQIVTRES